METFYQFFRKSRIFIVKKTIIIFMFFILMLLSWIANIIITNKLGFLYNRPNLQGITEVLSICFTIFTGLYAFCDFIYSKIDKIDNKKKEEKYQIILNNNREIISSLKLKENAIRQKCRDILKKLFEEFNLDSSCRITLFYCKEYTRNPESFHILERYSTGGRQDHFQAESTYMISIGVIKYIWENGFHSDIDKCPNYSDSSGKRAEAKRKAYIKYHEETYKVTEQMIKSMHMKACDFVGKNLSNDSANVILLFESRKNNKLGLITEDKLESYINKTFLREYLISHIELLNWVSLQQMNEQHTTRSLSVEDIRNEFNEEAQNG